MNIQLSCSFEDLTQNSENYHGFKQIPPGVCRVETLLSKPKLTNQFLFLIHSSLNLTPSVVVINNYNRLSFEQTNIAEGSIRFLKIQMNARLVITHFLSSDLLESFHLDSR